LLQLRSISLNAARINKKSDAVIFIRSGQIYVLLVEIILLKWMPDLSYNCCLWLLGGCNTCRRANNLSSLSIFSSFYTFKDSHKPPKYKHVDKGNKLKIAPI